MLNFLRHNIDLKNSFYPVRFNLVLFSLFMKWVAKTKFLMKPHKDDKVPLEGNNFKICITEIN